MKPDWFTIIASIIAIAIGLTNIILHLFFPV